MLDLAQLVRRHQGRVRRVLARAGVAPRDLPDAQQEVFIVAQRKLGEFEGRSSVATWLHRIARNVASQHRRLARNRHERLGVELGEPACAAPGPEASVEAQETRAFLARALEALPEPQRQALLLHDVGELSMHEVARAQDVPLKTAFSRVYAARRALKHAHDRWSALALLGLVLSLARRARALALPLRLAQLQVAAVALACALLGPSAAAPPIERSAAAEVAVPARPHASVAQLDEERVAPAPAPVRAVERRRAPRRVRPRVDAPAVAAPEPVAAPVRHEVVVVHESALDGGPRLPHPFAERVGLVVKMNRPRLTRPLSLR